MTEPLREYTVVVAGGGMAALSLARLLALQVPDASILTLDKGNGPTRKVGESTVELAASFLHRSLQLTRVLERTQLPKLGIRFWFDSAERDLTFAEASEDGPATLAFWRTYQLERETLEQELLELNRAAGVDHRYCVRITDVAQAAEGSGELHRVRFLEDGVEREARGRWLIDATGPASLLTRRAGLLEREERLPHGACWAWFRGARSPDELLRDDERRRRFTFGNRILSTNSFMYEGYWVWAIPHRSGALSMGVVYDKTVLTDPPKTADELRSFLEGHTMLAQMLEGAELEGFSRMDRYAERPVRYLGLDRTASMGMAGGFIDPLYSSGLDFIGLEAEYLVDLIRRERAGERLDPERVAAYDRFLALYYEQTVQFFAGLYKTFVSRELVVPRYRRDVHLSWNLTTWPFFSRQFLDLDFLRAHAVVAERSLERSRFASRLVLHTYGRLKERGELHRMNRRLYSWNQLGERMVPFIRFEPFLGAAMDLERSWGLHEEIDVLNFVWFLDVLFDGDRSVLRGLVVDAARDVFGDVLVLEAKHGLGDVFWEETFQRLSAALRNRLAGRGVDADGLEVGPDTFGRLRWGIRDAVASVEQRKVAQRYFFSNPELDDLEDLTVVREGVEPDLDWADFPGSGWDLGELSPQTVYDLLGERWWTRPVRQLPPAALALADRLR